MIHRAATAADAGPFSAAGLAHDLRTLGLRAGDTVLCHIALSEVGWTSGGRVALLQALRESVGTAGTVVVPSFTTYLVDPADWRARAVPPGWWDEVRATLPQFDPDLHACQPGLGTFPEVVRSHRQSHRSWHPVYSFTALGTRARALTDHIGLDFALGRTGVLGRLLDADVKVLAVGLPWWRRCTLFHLAESLAPFPGRREQQVRVRVGADWVTTRQLVLHEGDFEAMSTCMPDGVATGVVGAAESALLDGGTLVSRATGWLLDNRDWHRVDWPAYGFPTGPAPGTAV